MIRGCVPPLIDCAFSPRRAESAGRGDDFGRFLKACWQNLSTVG
jgi:hypothetical protein